MIKYLKTESGKQVPIVISYLVLKKFQEETGKNLISSNSLQNMISGELEVLLFHALKRGHKKADMEFTYKKEDMEELMDEVFFDFLKLIPEFFPKDDSADKSKQKQSQTEKKK